MRSDLEGGSVRTARGATPPSAAVMCAYASGVSRHLPHAGCGKGDTRLWLFSGQIRGRDALVRPSDGRMTARHWHLDAEGKPARLNVDQARTMTAWR